MWLQNPARFTMSRKCMVFGHICIYIFPQRSVPFPYGVRRAMGRTATERVWQGRSRASFGAGDAYRRSSTRAHNAANGRSRFGLTICNTAAGRLVRNGSRPPAPIRGGHAVRSWYRRSVEHRRRDHRYGWRGDEAMDSTRTVLVHERERALPVPRPYPGTGEGERA